MQTVGTLSSQNPVQKILKLVTLEYSREYPLKIKTTSMKPFLTFALTFFAGTMHYAGAQCEADHTIYLTDFAFTPSELTIIPGETIAFINAQGTHNVDGTAAGNPESFFIEESEGNIDGFCMGVVTLNVPGVYDFSSSVGVQEALGMVGSITVDANTLVDVLMNIQNGDGDLADLASWQSAFALNTYFNPDGGGADNGLNLNGNEPYTVFVPTDIAVSDLMELINLSQFDMLAFYDMVPALKYHIVPGIYMAEDLTDGMTLPTAEGQSLTISMGDQGAMVDDALITFTDFTAYNGVIHIIDKILAPSGYPGATTWDVIMQSDDHTLFEQAVLDAGLKDDFRGQPILNDNEPAAGPFTVFAPTDEALINFAADNGFADVNALLSSQFMDDIVAQYVVQNVYESGDLFNGQSLVSLANEILSIAQTVDGYTVNDALITQPDMLAYNGVVHALGEVNFDFPDIQGTCGSWTINMFSLDGSDEPWSGAQLDIYSNGTLIASESPNTFEMQSFSFAANANATIDIVYRGAYGSNYGGYEVEDENGYIVFSSIGSQSTYGSPQSVYGLVPCDENPTTCGLIEIVFTDESQDGWFGGIMTVISSNGVTASIPFNQIYEGFTAKSVMASVDAGPVDFIVSSPGFYPDMCGYIVKDVQGNVILEETSLNEPPPSTYGLVICEGESSNIADGGEVLSSLSAYPNPANGMVQLTGLAAGLKWEATLVSAAGKLIKTFNGTGPQSLEFFGLETGFYSLNLRTLTGELKSLRLIQN